MMLMPVDEAQDLSFSLTHRRARAPRPVMVCFSSGPGQVVVAERQVAIALPGDLEDGIGNAGLNRGAAVVTHAVQPMPGLEESDVDLRRVLVDARQQECVEVALRNAAFRDVALLMHRV